MPTLPYHTYADIPTSDISTITYLYSQNLSILPYHLYAIYVPGYMKYSLANNTRPAE